MYTSTPIVPTRYWPMVHGNTPVEVEQDLKGLQILRQMARSMAWMPQCIEACRQSGVPLPAHEETRIATNSVRQTGVYRAAELSALRRGEHVSGMTWFTGYVAIIYVIAAVLMSM